MFKRVSFKNSFFIITLALCLSVAVAITKGYAGFEWIPPTQTQAEPSVKMAPQTDDMPVAALAPVQVIDRAPSSDTLLPLEPLPGEEPAAPAPVAEIPAAQPAPAPVMQVRDFTPSPSPAPMKAETKPAVIMPEDAPVNLTEKILTREAKQSMQAMEELKALPPLPQPEPTDESLTVTKTKIMMPEDAPISALEHMKNDDITIQPFPKKDVPEAPHALETMADTAEAAPAPTSAYEEIMGFGTDIPLALALSQIVPPSYSYSFGESINPGKKVSWDGGKPWDQVIENMIEPLGLHLSIRGKNVHVGNHKTSMISNDTPPAVMTPVGAEAPETGGRSMIKDPGEVESSQPGETLSNIQDIVREDAPEKVVSIKEPEPAAPPLPLVQNIEEQEVIVAKVGVDMVSGSKDISLPPPSQTIDLTVPPTPVEIKENIANKTTQAKQVWEAQKGDSLKKTLDFWGKKANFEIVWDADHDYKLESDILVTGTFQRAVKLMFSNAISQKDSPLLTLLDSTNVSEPGKLIIQDDAA